MVTLNGKYGETLFICRNLKVILKVRNLTYEKAGKLLGYNSRQEIYYLVNKKLDCFWSDKEIDNLCLKLKVKKQVLLKGLL